MNMPLIPISSYDIYFRTSKLQMVAFLLIGVATYAKTSSIVVTLPIVGGMVACGVFLLFVAVLGLVATVKHHQVMLFFYMMILFVIFVIQFSVACACIGVNLEQEKKMSSTVSIKTHKWSYQFTFMYNILRSGVLYIIIFIFAEIVNRHGNMPRTMKLSWFIKHKSYSNAVDMMIRTPS